MLNYLSTLDSQYFGKTLNLLAYYW